VCFGKSTGVLSRVVKEDACREKERREVRRASLGRGARVRLKRASTCDNLARLPYLARSVLSD
jgi:hypothetical protein